MTGDGGGGRSGAARMDEQCVAEAALDADGVGDDGQPRSTASVGEEHEDEVTL